MIHLEEYFKSIQDQVPDITYIGIGTACIRDSKPENMQQFPPWLESEYRKSDKTFCLINIDPKFESPYLLTQMFPIEEDPSSSSADGLFQVFKTDRLVCIYINEALEYYDIVNSKCVVNELAVRPLDSINRLLIDKSKLLISGIYTGASNDILEQYFKSLYSDTYLYDVLITYNFMDDAYGSCMVDLTTNFPLIDFESNQIIKIDQIVEKLDLDTIKTIYGTNIHGLEQKITSWSINKLRQLSNSEMYLYRNYLNRNYQPTMEWAVQRSAFVGMDLSDYSNFDQSINKMLEIINLTYLPCISFLKSSACEQDKLAQLLQLIQLIPTTPTNIYNWVSNYTKLINSIAEKPQG